jgi:hypothetical protein
MKKKLHGRTWVQMKTSKLTKKSRKSLSVKREITMIKKMVAMVTMKACKDAIMNFDRV